MNPLALTLLMLTQALVTGATLYFLLKVLKSPEKTEKS